MDLNLWDVDTGELIASHTPTNAINEVAFSPDDLNIATVNTNGSILIYPLSQNLTRPATYITGHLDQAFTLDYHPNGETIVSGGFDGRVKIYKTDLATPSQTLQYDTIIADLKYSSDEEILAVALGNGDIQLLDAESHNQKRLLKEKHQYVSTITFSPDSQTLISAGKDNSIKLWNLSTGELSLTIEEHSDEVMSLAFSPDSDFLVSGSINGKVSLWNLASGKAQILKQHEGIARTVTFSPNSISTTPSILASGSDSGKVSFHDITSGEEVLPMLDYEVPIGALSFDPQGENLIIGFFDGVVNTLDISKYQTNPEEKGLSYQTHQDRVLSVVFSSDGKLLASGSSNGTINVHDLQTETTKYEIQGFDASRLIIPNNGFSPLPLVFTPDDQLLISGGSSFNELARTTLKVWDMTTGELNQEVSAHIGMIMALAITPDGSLLATGSADRTIKLWSLPTFEPVANFDDHSGSILALAFSPDGQVLASGSADGTIRLRTVTP